MKNLTITVTNVPDKWIDEMWKAAIESAPVKLKPEQVDHITIDYSLLKFVTKRNAIEMMTTGVTIGVIVHYQQKNN